ncbi:MAG: neutral/alkaline non-lysosomal ceramidase N-terminal domain-containing protein, partial [Planctomycetota bacterium]
MRLLLLGLLLLVLCSPALAEDPLRAGAAVRDITPPPGMPLGGYGDRFGKTLKGVHDRLEAQALVIEGEGGRRLAVVSLDTVGVDEHMRAALLARLPADLGIGDADLLLTATHNHSGPGALAKRLVWPPAMGRFNEKLFARTADRVAEAVVAAAADLRPATLRFGRTSVRGLVRNRRNRGGAVDE